MVLLPRRALFAAVYFLVLIVLLTEAQLYIGPYSGTFNPIAPRAWIHGYGRVRRSEEWRRNP
jgi:hypothetical protein